MELYLFFLAPHEQYTSIDRCALFMRAKQKKKKKKFYFTSLFIKIIFLFSFLFSSRFTAHLSLSLSLSLSHVTSLCSLRPKLLSLSSHRSGLALAAAGHTFTSTSHALATALESILPSLPRCRPTSLCHQPISPSPPSHCSPNADPSTIADSSFITDPSSIVDPSSIADPSFIVDSSHLSQHV